MRTWRVVEELAHSLQCGIRASTWWRHGHHSGWVLPVSDSCGGHHGCGTIAGVRPTGSPHPRMGSSLLLSPLLMARGTRGACNGSNVYHHGETQTLKWFTTLPPFWHAKCQNGLQHIPRKFYKSSPRRFVVGGTKALVYSSMVNMMVYVVRTAGA
jgi:hypothetical protein